MAVLSRDTILELIKNGALSIDPLDEHSIGPASIDLHLGTSFRIFKQVDSVLHVTEDADFKDVTELVDAPKEFLLMPGQTAHAATSETIILPPTLCGWIQGRSRFGRLGLMVHITASFVQPGSSGNQILEMNNAGPIPLALHPGIAICQLIFEELNGRATYKGKFSKQTKP